MTGEKLLDAMQYLPDGLLEQTDRLRQKKPVYWQPLAAMAACLCLVLGLVFGGQKAAENGTAEDAAPENLFGDVADGSITGNSSTGFWYATVVAVAEDRLTVTLWNGSRATVLLTELENRPQLEPGQRLRLYLNENQWENQILTPYKIEIEQETP